MKPATRLAVVLAAALSPIGVSAAHAQLAPPVPPPHTSQPEPAAQEPPQDMAQGTEIVLEAAEGVLGGTTPAAGSIGRSTQTGRVATSAEAGQAERPRISVKKTNDADGDGRFTDSEEAPNPNADVRFRVTIDNEGSTPVQIEEIRDDYEETTVFVCERLIGDRIEPTDRATCTFELEDYSPRRFDSLANTIEVTVDGAPGQQRTGTDVSTVTTINGGGGTQVLGETVTNQGGAAGNEAGTTEAGSTADRQGSAHQAGSGGSLATTGAPIRDLAGSSVLLAAAGWLFLTAGRRRGRSGVVNPGSKPGAAASCV